MAVIIISLLSVTGITALVAKPELTKELNGMAELAIFAPDTTALSPSALAKAEQTDLAGMEARTNNNLSAIAETLAHHAPRPIQTAVVTKRIVKASDAHQQLWVTNWLSKRYRVASDVTNLFVSTAFKAAKETKLDPLLILAVMAIESGLNPFAESPVGAQGLMQVMSKVHQEKFEDFGGLKAALNPTANIKVGSLILKDYVSQGGSVEAGLKRYVGAAAFATDGGYGNRVLAEYRRLQDVATGKNVSSNGGMAPSFAPKQRVIPLATKAPSITPDTDTLPAEAAADVKAFKQRQADAAEQLATI
ncbi:soluble lytic murein transglycosylase-like protein [Glaciimonas immobilis]|uniref:Soluble lytic murein transglycosylase-like protein n=2 Tax=Glaciimonas immobilis TaxID=728004 RepID=A0A840S0W1_9BURK|nr:lytic transglycosylase domain-containing protein [Glaciimonas immobilis]MBB5202514.1 soluble lytic murein transglycosylase-like protein [Glaciimonas immobilis]